MKFCSQCGSRMEDNEYTCPNCGTVFAAPDTGAVPPQPQQPSSYEAPQQNNAPDYGAAPPQYQQPY